MAIHNQFTTSLFFDKTTIEDAVPDLVYLPGGSFHQASFALGKDQFRVDFKPSKMTFTFRCVLLDGVNTDHVEHTRGYRRRSQPPRDVQGIKPVVIQSTSTKRIDVRAATAIFLSEWRGHRFRHLLEQLRTKVWGGSYPNVSLTIVEEDAVAMAAKLLLDGEDKAVLRFAPDSAKPYLMVLPDYFKGRHVIRTSSFNELARIMRRQYAAYVKAKSRDRRRSS